MWQNRTTVVNKVQIGAISLCYTCTNQAEVLGIVQKILEKFKL